MISKDGFSVVAPISRMLPFSTCGRNASCCALLKRWISSMKTMVRVPYWRARSASAMTCLISFIPVSTAENSRNSAFVMCAMILASVVLPVPGGPQKMSEPVSSRSIWVRSGFPGAIRGSWPTNSSSVRGRMRSASGLVRSGAPSSLGMGWNKLMGLLNVDYRLNAPQVIFRNRKSTIDRKSTITFFAWLSHTAKCSPPPPRSATLLVAHGG